MGINSLFNFNYKCMLTNVMAKALFGKSHSLAMSRFD
jgi:hypothetical protein